jgi:DnaK suppressor protein
VVTPANDRLSGLASALQRGVGNPIENGLDVEGASVIMKKTRTTHGVMDTARYTELKTILEERRREIVGEVQARIKNVRAEGAGGMMQTVEMGDSSEADVQDDIEFALIQMKAETLQKIDQALVRLEEGDYGYCFECGEDISQQRLRALPFALRCKDCEEAREIAAQRERVMSQRRGAASLFVDLSS